MRTWTKRLVVAGVVLLLLLALGVAGAWAWLNTDGGGEFVRAQAVAALEKSLPGKLTFDSVKLDGSTVTLRGVHVKTPDGAEVLSAEQVTGDLDLAALTSGTIHLRTLALERAHLVITRDEKGITLPRAFVREVSDDKPSSHVTVDLDAITLEDSTIDYRDDARSERLAAVSGNASFKLRTPPLNMTSSIALNGQLAGATPMPADLKVTLDTPSAGDLRVAADVKLKDSVVHARFTQSTGAFDVENSTVTPEALQHFVAGWPVKVPLVVKAHVAPHALDVAVAAGSGRVSLLSAFDSATQHLDDVTLTLEDLDPAQLTGGERPSRIGGSFKGHLHGFTPETATGALQGTATWHATDGALLGKAVVDVTAAKGALDVKQATITVPGARAEVKGTASRAQLALSAEVDASNLATLEETLKKSTGLTIPPLSGTGRLTVTATGKPTAPRVTAKGKLQNLHLASLSATALDVDLRVPDITKPLDTDGSLIASKLSLGSTTFDAVKLELATTGRRLDVNLTTKGLGDTRLHVVGKLDADADGAELEVVELRNGDTVWQLESPTTVGWSGQSLRVAPTVMVSGRQRLALQLQKNGARIDGNVTPSKLLLETLPHALLPEAWGVRGEVSGSVRVEGKLPRPDVVGALTLSRASAFGLDVATADISASTIGGIATGSIEAKTSAGHVDGNFELPLKALEHDVPVRAHVTLHDVDVQHVAALAKKEVPVEGLVDLTLTLSGTSEHPHLTLDAESVGLKVTTVPELSELARPKVSLFTTDDGTLSMRFDVGLLAGTATGTLKTPLRLADVVRAPPTLETLKQTDVDGTLTVSGLDVHAFVERFNRPLAGRLSASVKFLGSVRAPKLDVEAQLKRATLDRFEGLEVAAKLSSRDDETRLSFTSTRQAVPFLDANVTLGANLRGLRQSSKWSQLKLAVDGTLHDIALASLVGKDSRATGTVRGQFHGGGRLGAPQFDLKLRGEQLKFSKVALGEASLLISTNDGGEQVLHLSLKNQDTEQLVADGVVGLALRWPEIQTLSTSYGLAPIDLRVDAPGLDLDFLSGAHPMLRRLAGRLSGNARVQGVLGQPELRGHFVLRNGRLALAGYGEYRDMRLEGDATEDSVRLTTCEVRAGAGNFKLTGSATRQAEAWVVSAQGDATRFPLINDDQLMANVTLAPFVIEGTVGDEMVNIRKVAIPTVDVELPDVRRKNLQSLDRPGDIVVVRGGVSSKKARAAAQTQAKATTYQVRLQVPDVRVHSSDVNLALGLSDDFTVTYLNALSLNGRVTLRRGWVEVISRRFDIAGANGSAAGVELSDNPDASHVDFSGALKQGFIDVKAVHNNAREQVKVTVAVRGQIGTLGFKDFKLTSSPTLSEDEIYTLLATGRRDLRQGSGASFTQEQAASTLGMLAVSQLKGVLAANLPIDVLTVDTGAEGGFASTRLEVGKYLNDWFYVGSVVQPGANQWRGENIFAGRVELRLSKRWNAEVSAGTAPAGSAEVVWSNDF